MSGNGKLRYGQLDAEDVESMLCTQPQRADMLTVMAANKAAIEAAIAAVTASLNASLGGEAARAAAAEATKALLAGDLAQAFQTGTLTVNGAITPATSGTIDIGSPEKRFKNIYVDEAHLAVHTLYLGDTPVLGTDQDTITIKADPNQSILVKTQGIGYTQIQSDRGIDIQTDDANANVAIMATGLGANITLSANNEVVLQAASIVNRGNMDVSGAFTAKDVTISGNLTVQGSTTTINSQQLTVTDNIIEVNKGEVGSGVTAGQAGLKVNRGEQTPYMMIFDEVEDMFKVGMQGQLETIASRPWVLNTVQPAIEAEIANMAGVTQAVVLSKLGTLTKAQSDALGIKLDVVTATTNGLMSAADKATFDAIPTTYAAKSHQHTQADLTGPIYAVYAP